MINFFFWKLKEDGSYDKFKVEKLSEDEEKEIIENKRQDSITDDYKINNIDYDILRP